MKHMAYNGNDPRRTGGKATFGGATNQSPKKGGVNTREGMGRVGTGTGRTGSTPNTAGKR